DQLSPHVFAAAIVYAARERGLRLDFPEDVAETAGAGISGRVGKTRVALGKASWLAAGPKLPEPVRRLREQAEIDGTTAVFVAIGGAFAGCLTLEDPLRSDAPRVVRALRRLGVRRVVLLSGDRQEIAEAVGTTVGTDQVFSEHSPEQKVAVVRHESASAPTVMVGDGINDAAALAVAQVGVAMGARGATAASEAADVVIIVDRLERVVDAIRIAQRSRSIALQSVVAGMAMSGVAMLVAAGGWLPPVAGAILQEFIDVAVILNSLRALGGSSRRSLTPAAAAARERFAQEHSEL